MKLHSFIGFIFLLATIQSCSPKMNVQAIAVDTSAKKVIVYNNDINAKVLRSFYKTHGEVTGAKWVVTNSGYAVSFPDKGVNSIVHYKNNGTLESRILYYFEDRLSPVIRHLVKSNFYDYAITHVTEVHKNEFTAYYVLLENKVTIKTMKISGGEWEIAETIVKRN